MRKTITFQKGIYEAQIHYNAGFKYVNLISAKINNTKSFKGIPSVELILLNDTSMFTSFSNLINGTNNLHCYDLLLTASNNPALSNETFHTLKCKIPKNGINQSIELEMEFEIE